MRHGLKKIISLVLCLSLISSFLSCYASAYTGGNRVTVSSDENMMTIETTDGNVIQIEIEEVEDAYIIRQYTDGEFVDEARLDKNYMLRNNGLRQASTRVYVGRANYKAGFYNLDYEYDIAVSVYRNTTINTSDEYTPKNNVLTVADFIAEVVSVLSIPIGLVNGIVGAFLAGASYIGGKIISWQESKIPELSCTSYSYVYDLYHYGNAPIYNEGECINRSGAKYVVTNNNEESEYIGNTYYEGLIVESQSVKAAEDIYHSLYIYTPFEFVEWS